MFVNNVRDAMKLSWACILSILVLAVPVGADSDAVANCAGDSRGKGRSHAADGLE